MNSERLKKIENESKKILSNIIFEETSELLNDFWLITITEVKISADFSYIDVFVSSMKSQNLLTKALAKKNHIIQHRYNKTLDIRKLPKIRYRYDNKWETSEKILETINKITKDNEKI